MESRDFLMGEKRIVKNRVCCFILQEKSEVRWTQRNFTDGRKGRDREKVRQKKEETIFLCG